MSYTVRYYRNDLIILILNAIESPPLAREILPIRVPLDSNKVGWVFEEPEPLAPIVADGPDDRIKIVVTEDIEPASNKTVDFSHEIMCYNDANILLATIKQIDSDGMYYVYPNNDVFIDHDELLDIADKLKEINENETIPFKSTDGEWLKRQNVIEGLKELSNIFGGCMDDGSWWYQNKVDELIEELEKDE